jgi:putative intracellular protease/amidase
MLAPIEADVKSIRALARKLRPAGVQLLAASECHGEVRGERKECLHPNLLLIEAAHQDWDALLVAGGTGALRVVEDQFAREIIEREAGRGRPVAAIGLGRAVLERAGVAGLCAPDASAVAGWLCTRLQVEAPADWRFRLPRFWFHRRRSAT